MSHGINFGIDADYFNFTQATTIIFKLSCFYINFNYLAFIRNISNTDLPDKALVDLYKETENLDTLAILFQRYMDLLYGVCFKYLKDAEAAKDAVMQIFEELVQKLNKHEVDNFKSWLHTLAKNYCLMQLRTPKNLKTV